MAAAPRERGGAARVLVVGAPGGAGWGPVVARVGALDARAGPFAAALVCGGAAPPAEGAREAARAAKEGRVPVYFFGGGSAAGVEEALAAVEAEAPGSLGDAGLHHLGRCGVRRLPCGACVAYAGGRWRPDLPGGGAAGEGETAYGEAELGEVEKAAAAQEGDVDFLLSEEWPEGAAQGLAGAPEGAPRGSRGGLRLALSLRPRYHFASFPGAPHWARAPYLNADLGAGAHVTRFVSLGSVNNPEKNKWVNALQVVPASEMELSELHKVPPGTTPCPYSLAPGPSDGPPRGKRRAEGDAPGGQGWRWEGQGGGGARQGGAPPGPGIVQDSRKTVFVKNLPFSASRDELRDHFKACGEVIELRWNRGRDGRPNGFAHIQFDHVAAVEDACKLDGSDFGGRKLYVCPAGEGAAQRGPPQSVGHCWFCLSNPACETKLVYSIAGETYAALDKGAITPSHSLIVTIQHEPSSLKLSDSGYKEVWSYLDALRLAYEAQGLAFVWFERYLALRNKEGGNHCHVNAIGIPAEAAGAVEENFQRVAQTSGFKFDVFDPKDADGALEKREQLRDRVGDMEYVIVGLPGGRILFHPIMRGERLPMNLARDAVACAAGRPERGDWKNCKSTPEEEEKLVAGLKSAFAKFDFTS